MKLTCQGLQTRADWEYAGIALPQYDVAEIADNTKNAPVWVHFGIGNIFRIFLGGIVDKLISDGFMNKGLNCVESYDFEVVDKIYKPHDNLAISVILHNDGKRGKRAGNNRAGDTYVRRPPVPQTLSDAA